MNQNQEAIDKDAKGSAEMGIKLSRQGKDLIALYTKMASKGLTRTDGAVVEQAYNDFQLKKFRHIVDAALGRPDITSVLDYGGGGSDWHAKDFDPSTGRSAAEFFGLTEINTFEPARALNQKSASDCVICMDVLEHIFLVDVPRVIRELFSLSRELLVMNIACYRAAALLPNGENAHITMRKPDWWKGIVDAISLEFPGIEVLLICSESFSHGVIFDSFTAQTWIDSPEFTIDHDFREFGDGQKTPGKFSLSAEQIIEAAGLLIKTHPQFTTKIAGLLAGTYELKDRA